MVYNNKKASVIMKILIIYYAFYIIIGNLPKMFHVSFSKGDIVVTELILYIFCIIIFMIYRFKFPKLLIGICVIFFISNFWGILYHGQFSMSAFSYPFRMSLMVISSVVIGNIFYIKYGDRGIKKVIDIYMIIYIIYCIIGWIIYIRYPNSVDLWYTLSQYNIIINGDPHQNRFLGTYFDPNFLGNIIIFPILLSLYAFYKYDKKYILLLFIFTFTLICTVSRSALLGLFICIILLLFVNIMKSIRTRKIKKYSLYLIIFLIVFVFMVVFLEHDTIIRLVNRVLTTYNDPSAAHRFDDMKTGVQFFENNSILEIIFGIGYSFIKNDLNIMNLNSLDSSLLNTIICFGLIGTISLTICIIGFLHKIKVKKFNDLFTYIVIYIISSLVMCNFNNLLYYQFYVMMLLPFLDYMYNCKRS